MKPLNLSGMPFEYSQLNCPIRLRLAHAETVLDDVLIVARLTGQETLCGGFEYHVDCFSTQANLPLKAFIALPAELQFVTDRGALHSVCGIVAQVCAGPSDGGLATYRVVIRDALALMEQRTNSRIFQNTHELDISVALVREWRSANPILAMAFELDTAGVTKAGPPRELTRQLNESDAAFLRRIWKRCGIGWFFRPGQSGRPGFPGPPVHVLTLFNKPQSLAQNAVGTARFHRDASTEERDGVIGWNAVRTLKPGYVSRQSWNPLQGRMMSAHSPTLMKLGGTGTRFAASIEDYQIDSAGIAMDSADYGMQGDLRMQRHEYESKYFDGESGVRDLRVGEWFRLDGHPEIDSHPEEEREFVITDLSVAAESNFPKDLDERLQHLFASSFSPDSSIRHGLEQASQKRGVKYTNRFTCVRRGTPIVPAYDPRTDVPRARLQSAIVVGPAGEEVHCDRLGRIKLRFLGTREQDHQDRGGASNTDLDSPWVRVATSWASNRWGGVSLPRVGDEVLVDFVNGDPDRPMVIGRVYGGAALPPSFSHTGDLPGNRFLAGIKSKEVKGTRYNQLRLDDTPGQISAQLASEHGHSQLNLGSLTHPRKDGRGDVRGEGAELRSDHSVVVRAAQLMLLTTQAMLGAAGKQLERAPLQALLESSQALLKELGEFAEQHNAQPVDLTSHQKLADGLDSAGDASASDANGGGTAAALIAQYADAGFVSATPKSTVSYSGRQQNLVAQQHIQIVAGQRITMNAGKGISLFAHQDGMKHIARAGKLEIQAQQDSIGIAADLDVQITASQGDVVIAAKKSLTLLCGGAYIKICDGKIEHGCAGDFTVKAASHRFDGPAQQDAKLPFFPAAEHTNWLKLDLDGYEGAAMAGVPYTLYMAGGQEKEGTLDGNGMAEERNLPDTIDRVVYHNAPLARDEPRAPVEELLSALDQLAGQVPRHFVEQSFQGDE